MTENKKICLFLIPLFIISITLASILSTYADPAPPIAAFTWTRALSPYTPETFPSVNETVNFDASDSIPNGGTITGYAWDFDDDGIIDKTVNQPTTTWNFTTIGTHNVTLNVTDSEGEWDTVSRILEVVKKPHISVNPPVIVSEPGANFTVDINITDAYNMWAFSFKLDYETYILDATLVSPTNITKDAPYWVPTDENMEFHWNASPTIDDTQGTVHVGFFLQVGTGFTGNGTLLRINFTATRIGNSTLHLYDTAVADIWSDPYPHETSDGEVSVIPEFPTFTIMPLLLIASLTAILLGKTLRPRKPKDALTA